MKIILSLIAVFVFNFFILKAEFNPNYIISDSEILDYDDMDLEDIQDFLESQDSFLKDYITEDAYGEKRKASEIIYQATHENYNCNNVKELEEDPEGFLNLDIRKEKCQKTTTVNPKFVLALLQKEQSLITKKNPEQSRLDWATGYGCPDGGGCKERWRGFGKQVNSACLQFLDYINNPKHYPYKVDESYVLTNPYAPDDIPTTSEVIPQNLATAGLYNYTPHVYNGNFNFYNFWQKYFTRTYPNGTLLKLEDEQGVFLIEHGRKRPFLSYGALRTCFDPKKIIIATKSELDKYYMGDPIKFANYSVLKEKKDGNIYLLVDDQLREFVSEEAFRKIGINPEEIISVSQEDINIYQMGSNITATSTYPLGALLQDNKTGGVYWVEDGKKAPLIDRVFLETKFKDKEIISINREDLDLYETIDPVLFDDGELIKSAKYGAVYLISNQKRRAFATAKSFEKLGYNWDNIILVPEKIVKKYQEGKLITE